MDWTLSGGVPCVSLISLGTLYQDTYYISDNCLPCLHEISKKLSTEDSSLRSLRRALGFMDIINKDLIPLLLNSKDDPAIFRETVKVLVELTTPVECLLPEGQENNPSSLHVLHDLRHLLYSVKEAFLDPRPIKAIIDHFTTTIEKQPLSSEECEAVNSLLLLIRNVLHAPERPPPLDIDDDIENDLQKKRDLYPHRFTAHSSQQNQLLWNLFTQGFDCLLISILSFSQKEEWTVLIVQLIALFYKDQNAESLQKLLVSWLDSGSNSGSNSDSDTEDNESNTSPLNETSELYPVFDAPTSEGSTAADEPDQSQGNTSGAKGYNTRSLEKSSYQSSGFQSEGSNRSLSSICQEMTSRDTKRHHIHGGHKVGKKRNNMAMSVDQGNTSSSPDNSPTIKRVPMKAKSKQLAQHSGLKNEERRKKFYSRSRLLSHKKLNGVRSNILHSNPSEEDVSQLMKEFTLYFLLNGYNALVGTLHQQLIHESSISLDKSHFLWLISYFLRIISQLELEVKRFPDIFKVEMLNHLTWEAVKETEQFIMTSLVDENELKPCLRRLHLGVTAIREYVQALETYSRSTQLCPADRDLVSTVRAALPHIGDLHQVFLLQLLHFNPLIQSRLYLHDIITANHVLILTVERAAKEFADPKACFDVEKHLEQFCNAAVMDRYGRALEDFRTNGPFLNDCIMTILHHVGTDLGRADLLCTPIILKPFGKMWEEEFNMCDDWDDLIEFVVNKFLTDFNKSRSLGMPDQSQEDRGSSVKESDRNPCASEANICMQTETTSEILTDPPTPDENVACQPTLSTIDSLKTQLAESGYQSQMNWIQQSLLTVCSARLGTYQGQEFKHTIVSLSHQMNVPCPIVPWTNVEALALQSELFVRLLDHIGLLPPNNAGLFPRIPREWDADALYTAALFLGPVDPSLQDFDLTRVKPVDFPITPVSGDDCPTGTHTPWLGLYLGPGPSTSFSAMPRPL